MALSDDSGDIAAALELELEAGSPEKTSPRQSSHDGEGDANKKRRIGDEAERGRGANGATTTTTENDVAAPPRRRQQRERPSCAHPATMGGICVVCGVHVQEDEPGGAADERERRRRNKGDGGGAAGAAGATTAAGERPRPTAEQEQRDQVALRYIHQGLRVSAAEAARLREASDAASRATRRLHLVLDLDHTLLNSTRLDEVPQDTCGEAMDELIAKEEERARTSGEGRGGRAAGGEDDEDDGGVDARREGEEPPFPFPFHTLPSYPPHPSRTLFHLPAINLWTKLRPGVRGFLRERSKKYELAVYTHGDRAYASAMARLLDPTGELFGGRVISHGDSTSEHTKSLDVVLGSDSTTVVVDDTRAVWPGHEANLLLVDRYIFFPACARKFCSSVGGGVSAGAASASGNGNSGRAGSDAATSGSGTMAAAVAAAADSTPAPPPATGLSWLEKKSDEDEGQGMLAVAARVLDSVHESYFRELDERNDDERGGETPPPDVRRHLDALRSSVLRGCTLVLSGLAPMGTPLEAVPAARVARSLGAEVEEKLEPGETTHVVAAADGTAKVKGARAHNARASRGGGEKIHCVSPEWLSSCLFRWERADERLFPVATAASAAAGARGGGQNQRQQGAFGRSDAEDLAAAAAAAGRAGS